MVAGCRGSAADPHDTLRVVLIWLVALAAAPQGSESPTKAVRGTVMRVIGILEDPALQDSAKLVPAG
ncbi:MAG: hypothetical protein U0223_07800 [Nitrospira sp.]